MAASCERPSKRSRRAFPAAKTGKRTEQARTIPVATRDATGKEKGIPLVPSPSILLLPSTPSFHTEPCYAHEPVPFPHSAFEKRYPGREDRSA